MKRLSAGLLMYRARGAVLEVLLVHPGGPFWRKKDLDSWSIPKGEYHEHEEALVAAKREFKEETGIEPRGDFIPLGVIKQPSGKLISAWGFEGDCSPRDIHSNMFSIEWPPKSGKMQEFPEVDRAGWFSLEEARERILKGQSGFLDRLLARTKTAPEEKPAKKSDSPGKSSTQGSLFK
jgi:predicted NUDIX family NTP pyrophosphohydrolase